MTLLDERPDTNTRHRRSWRDLPPSPPVGTVLAPPDPVAPPFVVPAAPVPNSADMTATIPVPPPPTTLTGPSAPAPQPRRSRKGLVIAAVAATVLVAGAVTAVALQGDDEPSGESTPTVKAPEPGSGAPASSPATVAAALGPAVVQIELSSGGAQGGIGSGVIYDAEGLVLTAHHVVAANDEVTVRTADDRTFTGRVVGRAPERDLAIVAIDGAEDLTAATIAEPGTVEVGEPAIALGSPFGFQQSVTAGIISGLDRELETPAGPLTGLIQTDAPINPGNSGGPLADAEARVIGINTAIASASGGNDGVGFAVPVEDASALLDEVEANGGIDAPTVPAPEDQGGGLGGLIPGLDELVPGLDELIPDLGNLPSLDELLQDFLGGLIPDEVGDFFDDFLGGGDDQQDQTPGGGN